MRPPFGVSLVLYLVSLGTIVFSSLAIPYPELLVVKIVSLELSLVVVDIPSVELAITPLPPVSSFL